MTDQEAEAALLELGWDWRPFLGIGSRWGDYIVMKSTTKCRKPFYIMNATHSIDQNVWPDAGEYRTEAQAKRACIEHSASGQWNRD